MKILFTAILAFVLSFSLQFVSAQSCSRIEAHLVQNDTIGRYLAKTFSRIRQGKNTNFCISSTVFAQFKISADGKIVEVNYVEYDKRYPVFKEILAELIASTQGLWIPTTENGKPVESKMFVFPLIFEMGAGCKISPNNESNEAFMELFTNGKTVAPIDCVLLPPYRMFAAQ
ncbi:energy transducer TonB [Mucilaginibacter agri]|uniref:TonB C-terminal domain-containing protein n=1 Tax=Mucilaginibacter agri TaxID=2695265 RepID=A0A965ZKE7_9SPHI|nr:hypothetical protein [Mucilaginibacter agri]NCD71549.1 hypothetical protein [Mucilaginibacter agri]